jgi:hypothetical protein
MLSLKRRLSIEIALESIACAVDDCARIVVPGELLHMRRVEGTAVHEPLCAVCATAALEDMKLLARISIHQREQELAR